MTRSLGSQLSAGMSAQLKTAKMVIAPRITPPYQLYRKNQVHVSAREGTVLGGTHEVERSCSDREVERRNLGC